MLKRRCGNERCSNPILKVDLRNFILVVWVLMFPLLALESKGMLRVGNPPKPVINKVWLEHSAYKNGEKGMMIHVDFSIANLKDEAGRIGVFFISSDGKIVSAGRNNQYSTTAGGQLTVQDTFTPIYDNSHWKDYKLFIPYSEFSNIVGGDYRCRVSIMKDGYSSWLVSDESATFSLKQDGNSQLSPRKQAQIDAYRNRSAQNSSGSVGNNNSGAKNSNTTRTNLPGGGWQEYTQNSDGSMIMRTYSPCLFCFGSKTCQGCFGMGGRMIYGQYFPCTLCGGTNVCHACKGTGGTINVAKIAPNGSSGYDNHGNRIYVDQNGNGVGVDASGRMNGWTGGSSSGSSSNNSNTGNSGTGQKSSSKMCHFCNGTGQNPCCEYGPQYTSRVKTYEYCSICKTTKESHYHLKCPSCGGKGTIE